MNWIVTKKDITMKKIAIISTMVVALLAGAQRLSAQRPVGDTIVGADSTYMYYIYDWWRCANHDQDAPQWYTISTTVLLSWAIEYNSQAQECFLEEIPGGHWPTAAGNCITGVQMVTDHPIKVLGVAACAFAQQPRDTALSWFLYELIPNCPDKTHLFPNTRDTTLAGRYTDSLLLMKPTASGPEYLTGGPWRVEDAHRYMPLPTKIDMLVVDTTRYAPNWETHPYHVIDSSPVVPLYEVMFD